MEIETMEDIESKGKWSKYYQNQKEVWYDPSNSIYEKVILRLVELHRSDSKGYSISIRRISTALHIATGTAQKYVNELIAKGFLESTARVPRKRRKLRLSVLLRAPVEFGNSKQTNLSDWKEQVVSTTKTKSVASDAPVNSNKISKHNIEQLPPSKEELTQNTSQHIFQHDSEGFKRLRDFVKKKLRTTEVPE
ncbi:MAG: hypothetical protein UU56_C0001G0044 [Candidatus Curtissbacteria bacterium GW2011_GWA2_41_24]|uniref:Uncharacterized protein n=1 Tax=Candidatus Curtissbacteria bacterium GW2011_GWA2_41_24 TaxID=1618411 RepID=A0A0G0VZC6_9BACT|nr:MAG: hypothetical protein UU56_C0001G0044 [Candidatus Curtissbacteria bacterium GW2011_GWA2_41_24]